LPSKTQVAVAVPVMVSGVFAHASTSAIDAYRSSTVPEALIGA
jgi:hypothetical protein